MVVEVPRGEAPGGARRLALSSPVGLRQNSVVRAAVITQRAG